MRGTRIITVLVATLALALSAVSTPAQDRLINRGVYANKSGGMSLDQAVAMAERRFKARVVRADNRKEDGRTVYVLRMLNDSGRVWTVRVDAVTGEVF